MICIHYTPTSSDITREDGEVWKVTIVLSGALDHTCRLWLGGEPTLTGPAPSVLTLLFVWDSITFSVSRKLCSLIHGPLDACPHITWSACTQSGRLVGFLRGRDWLPKSMTFVCGSRSLGLAPLPREFSRQEYWSGLPFPPPGDLPDAQGSNLHPLVSCVSAGRQVLYH